MKKPKGPKFVQYFGPLLNVLRFRGDRALRAKLVTPLPSALEFLKVNRRRRMRQVEFDLRIMWLGRDFI